MFEWWCKQVKKILYDEELVYKGICNPVAISVGQFWHKWLFNMQRTIWPFRSSRTYRVLAHLFCDLNSTCRLMSLLFSLEWLRGKEWKIGGGQRHLLQPSYKYVSLDYLLCTLYIQIVMGQNHCARIICLVFTDLGFNLIYHAL